jgi:hypothetical protein
VSALHVATRRLSDSPIDRLKRSLSGISSKDLPVYVERIMFGYLINMGKEIVLPHLICWTGMLLERAEHSRRDAYLESCADICELERRMRVCDIDT